MPLHTPVSREVTSAATRFAELARHYVNVIDSASGSTPYALLSRCARLLPLIYAGGIDLPEVEPATRDFQPNVGSPMSTLVGVLGRHDMYYEVSDPICDTQSIGASLSDDLADIYLDLARPLAAFDAGDLVEAIWLWKFNVRGHCGDHLVDALRAIHRLIHDHISPDG